MKRAHLKALLWVALANAGFAQGGHDPCVLHTRTLPAQTSYEGGDVGGALDIPRGSVDVTTAVSLWRRDLSGALTEERWSPPSGTTSYPRVLSDDRRLFYVREGALHAVHARTGKALWSAALAASGEAEAVRLELGLGTPLIAASASLLRAFDPETGRVRWERPNGTPGELETLCLHRDTLLVVSGRRLSAYELATGRERWHVHGLDGLTYDPHHTALAVGGGVVFLELSYHALTSNSDVHTFDLETGTPLWRANAHFNPLAVIGEEAYLLRDDYSAKADYPGRFHIDTYDLHSGGQVDSRTYNLNGAEVIDDYNHPHPWEDGRKLLHKGTIYAAAQRLGRDEANIARFSLRQEHSAPLLVQATGTLEWLAGPYDDKLFLQGPRNGKRRFLVGHLAPDLASTAFDATYEVGAGPIARLDLIYNGLYVAHTDGWFYAVNVRTGRAFFRVQTDAKVFGPSHVVGDTLVVQAGDELLAFDLPSAALELLEP